jgi:prophage regulatory protein
MPVASVVSPLPTSSVKIREVRSGRGKTHLANDTLPPDFPRILRLPAVEAAAGFKKSKLYAMVKEGQFPQPVRLGNRSVGWLAEEIQAWISARASQRS